MPRHGRFITIITQRIRIIEAVLQDSSQAEVARLAAASRQLEDRNRKLEAELREARDSADLLEFRSVLVTTNSQV